MDATMNHTHSLKPAYIKWLLAALLIPGLTWLYLFDPQAVPSTPPCVFHLLTNFDCPGCGTARACHQLLHGNLLQAINYNPLFVLLIPFLVVKSYSYLSGMPVAWIERFYRPKLVLWVVLLFWILRNVSLTPFNYLAASQ
jgi:hypothetical protein